MTSVQFGIVGVLSAAMGAAVLLFAHVMTQVILRPVQTQAESWDKESTRRIEIRRNSKLFCYFEPLIDDLSSAFRRPPLRSMFDSLISRLNLHLARGGHALPLTAEECLGLAGFQGILFASVIAFVLPDTAGWPLTILFSILAVGLVFASMIENVMTTSKKRMDQLKSRLPFAVDLMALTMAAGSTFPKSLSTAVQENLGHPLGEEFGEILRSLECGKTQQNAINALRERLRDQDVDEFVQAINNAEKLGAPMSLTLLRLAESMRMKRAQRIEAAVERANTMAKFPGFLFLIACLLVVLAPFFLSVQQNPLF